MIVIFALLFPTFSVFVYLTWTATSKGERAWWLFCLLAVFVCGYLAKMGMGL